MKMAPFNNRWPCSLLASQDPVAIDSVGFDFLLVDLPKAAGMAGADDYLHEAAQAGDPPSGTFYDPDHPAAVKRLEKSLPPGVSIIPEDKLPAIDTTATEDTEGAVGVRSKGKVPLLTLLGRMLQEIFIW